jgi:DNA-binding response OmpR family regulator
MTQKILLIDDEAPIRLLCRVNLEAEGFQVIEAANGVTGLQTARSESPDLIVLDVMMPGLDGWSVARELQDVPETQEIPFVFLTARTECRDRLRGLALGAVDYITLPFNPLELAPRLQELLERLAGGEDVRQEKLAEIAELMGRELDRSSRERFRLARLFRLIRLKR